MPYNYPAILVGGPANSGKSVLVNSLTEALRSRGYAHYLLRAAPDGEGDWFYDIPAEHGRALRKKGSFTADFVEQLDAYLSERHYPLLVDVGGRPTPEQARVLRHCTHAVLLVGEREDDPSRYELDRTEWLQLLREQGVTIVADLRSRLRGQSVLVNDGIPLRGTLSGLERGAAAAGMVFDRLVDRLQQILAPDEAAPDAHTREPAPDHIEYELVLPTLARQLGSDDGTFSPEQLPALREFVPDHVPFALFGRAPNWVYAALAEQALPEEVWLFDARLGWIRPPELPFIAPEIMATVPCQDGWRAELRPCEQGILLAMETSSQFLDINDPAHLPMPQPPEGVGVVLSGKVPNWLLAAALRQLAPTRPWLAVYQPQLGGAVVIMSRDPARLVGTVLDVIIPNI